MRGAFEISTADRPNDGSQQSAADPMAFEMCRDATGAGSHRGISAASTAGGMQAAVPGVGGLMWFLA